jgi:hypothetical protein
MKVPAFFPRAARILSYPETSTDSIPASLMVSELAPPKAPGVYEGRDLVALAEAEHLDVETVEPQADVEVSRASR